jgi:hypothetical protein
MLNIDAYGAVRQAVRVVSYLKSAVPNPGFDPDSQTNLLNAALL